MIHRDQQVAGRSASRRASVDFPAAIFPHRRYNVVMRSGFPCQGGPLRGQPEKNLLVLSFTVFDSKEKSTRFSNCSKTGRAVHSRRPGHGPSREGKKEKSPAQPDPSWPATRKGSAPPATGAPAETCNNLGTVCLTSHRPLRERVHRRKRVFALLRGSTSDDIGRALRAECEAVHECCRTR
jgi:hypothetical protein